MPFKTQSIKVLQQAPVPKRNKKEEILRANYAAFSRLTDWLQENGTGGKIVCAMPPNMMNGEFPSLHGVTQACIKSQYFVFMDSLRALRLCPHPPGTPPELAQITAHFILDKRAKLMDEDNLKARMKFPQDWLTRSGYIKDDKPAHLQWASQPTQEISAGGPPRLEITLREIKGEEL